MKRIICSSSNETTSLFDVTTTDTSFYDNFLNEKDRKYMEKEKNLTGHIEYWTPDKYYRECAVIFHSTKERLVLERSHEAKMVDQYVADMKKGDKFPLCYIDYSDNGQEGLHRMLAASKIVGWTGAEFPVLVVNVYDWERHERYLKRKAVNDYERWTFRDDINAAVSEISDWDIPVPEDVCEQMKEAVERIAKERHDATIVVECEIEELGGAHRLNVYLDSYNGIENQMMTNKSDNWLEDMFDTDATYQPVEPDDIDNIDDTFTSDDIIDEFLGPNRYK